MNPYSLAVCEDDRTIRETVCRFCDEILEEAGIPHEVTAFSRVEEAEAALAAKKQIHLLILDIETGGKTGVELAQELRDRDDERSILFITGYEKYLPVGYDVRPVQFLLKPINWEKLKKAVLTDWRLHHSPRTLILQKGRQTVRIPFRTILYVEAMENHRVKIGLEDGGEVFQYGLLELEQRLPADRFLRCHKSYLVNMDHVKSMEKTSFIMDDGRRIPIGRTYQKICREAVFGHVTKSEQDRT